MFNTINNINLKHLVKYFEKCNKNIDNVLNFDIKKSYFLFILPIKGVFITVVFLIWSHLIFIKVDFLINVKYNYYYFTCSLKLSKCFVSFLSPNLFFIFQF